MIENGVSERSDRRNIEVMDENKRNKDDILVTEEVLG